VISFFQNLQISSVIFWLGLIAGIIFAWILYRLRTYIPKAYKDFRHKVVGVRENVSIGIEERLRNDIFHFAQKQHLAAALFSLDEIVIEPKVLTPLIQSLNSIELAPTDSVSLTVPYIPDWPELAAVYNAPTMTLIEALQGGANIILAGHPGSGKSVALAWLAASIARNNKGLGSLAGLLPVYLHATNIPHLLDHSETTADPTENIDLDKSGIKEQLGSHEVVKAEDVVELLIQAVSTYASPSTLSRLPRAIRAALETKHAILLLDRVDELPPRNARIITEYLRLLQEKYPKLRIVVAMSFDYMAGLPTLGFSLLGMAAWSEADRINFLQSWSQQWKKWVISSEKSQPKKINSYYLKSWLSVNDRLIKPLEYTLKVWAAFSGDVLGTDGPSAIEAYIRRMTSHSPGARRGLERFALQMLTEMDITSNPSNPDRLISEYKSEIHSQSSTDITEQAKLSQSIPIKLPVISDIPGIDSLTDNGFLISYSGSHYGFSHPVIIGYLAGKALSESGVISQHQHQPSWTGKNLAMYYLAQYGDVTGLIQDYLKEDDILHTNHLLISRWLQVAPKNRAWRTIILRTLTSILQKERETFSLAAKVIAAMAFSGDTGVSLYFRQLLKSDHPNLKILSVLGCGILADKKATEELNLIIQEPSPASIRSASLALAAIGDKHSLEILATSLLNGNEDLRRYAAEALANDPKEGHPALQEGSSMEDLLVRRSVIFGLIRIDQPWARKIVENLQLDDQEWVVRNAAIQAFDELHRKNSYAPLPPPDLTETPWLVDYATKIGTTVAPGRPGEELVGKALVNGSLEEKLYAMDYFRIKCDPNTKEMIYSVFSKSTDELRDVAYYVLWLMTLAGIKLHFSFE